MKISLPLDEMAGEEKLQVMAMVWEDLSQNVEDLPPPDWHGEVLAQREAALNADEGQYEDWETVKEKLKAEHRNLK